MFAEEIDNHGEITNVIRDRKPFITKHYLI
jgi:hypothetical protein